MVDGIGAVIPLVRERKWKALNGQPVLHFSTFASGPKRSATTSPKRLFTLQPLIRKLSRCYSAAHFFRRCALPRGERYVRCYSRLPSSSRLCRTDVDPCRIPGCRTGDVHLGTAGAFRQRASRSERSHARFIAAV